MQLLGSREYPVIDYQTMAEFIGHERLFRTSDGPFLLYMSTEGELKAEERIVWLTVRDAISWLNEAPDQFGSLWEFAEVAPVQRPAIAPLSARRAISDGGFEPPIASSGEEAVTLLKSGLPEYEGAISSDRAVRQNGCYALVAGAPHNGRRK